MPRIVGADAPPALGFAEPASRGFSVTYRQAEPNRCPGCGRSHWHVGRLTAECAFCATALALDGVHG